MSGPHSTAHVRDGTGLTPPRHLCKDWAHTASIKGPPVRAVKLSMSLFMKACAFASACVCARTRDLLMDSCGFVRARLRLYLRLRAGGFPCARACARVHMSSQRRGVCVAVAVQRALCHHSLGGEPARSSAPGTAPLCYVSAFRASSVCAFSAATDYRQCRCAAEQQ